MEYPIKPLAKKAVMWHLITTAAVILLMMVFGVMMLLNQGELISISPELFYKIMTAHGTGMIGIAALGGLAIMWYFLSQYLPLNPKVLVANFIMFLLGVASILIGIFGFNFSDGWTFLYPLPSQSAQFGGPAGALFFLFGLLLIGVGFLVIYGYVAYHLTRVYGGLHKTLGWDYILGKKTGYGPPPAAVASTMVAICNSFAIIAGAVVIVASILNILNPEIVIDPLLAKHLTYSFGHVFANCTIYMAVIAVYEGLSKATNRPWESNKVFFIAWNFSTLFTLMIYTHHLLMDFAVPKWMLIVGQVFSYANGLPVMVVTAYGALLIVYRSGIKWKFWSLLFFLSMFGWLSGAIPAIIDATIVVNHIMHNTKWVPGHFHMYMGMGVITMIFGFMSYFNHQEGKIKENSWDLFSIVLYFTFFLGLCGSFLYAGRISVPRRWAEHLPEWVFSDQIGAFCGILIIGASLIFTIRFFMGIKSAGTEKKSDYTKIA